MGNMGIWKIQKIDGVMTNPNKYLELMKVYLKVSKN